MKHISSHISSTSELATKHHNQSLDYLHSTVPLSLNKKIPSERGNHRKESYCTPRSIYLQPLNLSRSKVKTFENDEGVFHRNRPLLVQQNQHLHYQSMNLCQLKREGKKVNKKKSSKTYQNLDLLHVGSFYLENRPKIERKARSLTQKSSEN